MKQKIDGFVAPLHTACLRKRQPTQPWGLFRTLTCGIQESLSNALAAIHLWLLRARGGEGPPRVLIE
jgi:hypothetical protein